MLGLFAILLAAAVISGSFTCLALVLGRSMLAMTVSAAAAAFAVGSWSVYLVERVSGRADSATAAAFLGLAGFLGGFALAAAFVPIMTRPRRLPTAPDPHVDPAGPPAFVVVADGRPERYDPTVMTETLDLLSDTEVPIPSDTIRVFAYLSERMRYRSAGLDPARHVVREVTQMTMEALRARGLDGPVYEAWLHGMPRLADAVATAMANGSRDIVVVPLEVAETVRLARARTAAEKLAPAHGPVHLAVCPPLWAEPRLVGIVAERIQAALPRGPRATDGAVLVADGQPWQWDREHPASCEHETFFMQRVRQALVNAGMDESHVRTAWLDWQDPGVTEAVRHLAALGCERIVVCPATTPADNLETAVDLPAAVAQAGVDPGVRVEILHGWGADPVVAEVLASAALMTARDHGLL
jgi:sirohydrochlorin ferrochelatase